MSFFKHFVTTTMRNIHDGAIKTLASWDPETVGEVQLAEWNQKAAELAKLAAEAAAERDSARKRVEQLEADFARYSAAAKKLAESNATAAEKAVDQALELKEQLAEARQILEENQAWADETLVAAQAAQEKVAKGRQAIEAAKREQTRAKREQEIAEQRLKDRERMAGITRGLDGTDIAIDALKSNAAAAKKNAAAANIRSGVLNKGADADAAIQAALAEVDGKSKPKSLQDKLSQL